MTSRPNQCLTAGPTLPAHTTAAPRPTTPTSMSSRNRGDGGGGFSPAAAADTTLLNPDSALPPQEHSHVRADSSGSSDQTPTPSRQTQTPPPPPPPPPMNHILGIGSPQSSPLRLHFSAPLRSPGLFSGGGGGGSRSSSRAAPRLKSSLGGLGSNSPEGAATASHKTDDEEDDIDGIDDYDPTVEQESLDDGNDDNDDNDDDDHDHHDGNHDNHAYVSPATLRRNMVKLLEDQLTEVLSYLKTSAGNKLETADFVAIQDQVDNIMDVFRRRGCPKVLVGPPPRGSSRTVNIFKNLPLTPPQPRGPAYDALVDDDDNNEVAERRPLERTEKDKRETNDQIWNPPASVRLETWSSSTTAASASTSKPLGGSSGGGGGAGLAAAASSPADVADLVVAEAEKLCLELSAVAKSLNDRRQDIYLACLSREENVRITEYWSCSNASKSSRTKSARTSRSSFTSVSS
ncbi:hypothetical protein MAPG_08640 [Magnaporthiopsis poae ATCC 64411]|uniref:Uncharacterized protein n=1 Tax=Magnaporthiopsis poae (strain ATCC 64411 / 73-15) TaxID=644358 RepID=A0A0C4E7W4_MAGP6|nr:hypothetical protein MAPG_08640 [Magnaporthiopsis poae ATCC 64411]